MKVTVHVNPILSFLWFLFSLTLPLLSRLHYTVNAFTIDPWTTLCFRLLIFWYQVVTKSGGPSPFSEKWGGPDPRSSYSYRSATVNSSGALLTANWLVLMTPIVVGGMYQSKQLGTCQCFHHVLKRRQCSRGLTNTISNSITCEFYASSSSSSHRGRLKSMYRRRDVLHLNRLVQNRSPVHS